jgi:hypothetical protein
MELGQYMWHQVSFKKPKVASKVDRKNTRHSVKFEFEINNEYFC